MKNLYDYEDTQSATVDLPFGAFKNESAPGKQDGTAIVAEHIQDIVYPLYQILQLAGITPDGELEDGNSKTQFIQALTNIGIFRYSDKSIYNKSVLVWNVIGSVFTLYRSVKDNNNADINDTASWIEILKIDGQNKLTFNSEVFSGGGGGFEVGDIGTSALGVDETKGLRRYLNGQILTANANTQEFINKLKSTAALFPSIVCTETEWQAIVAASDVGQCGKFVINYDTDGTTIISVRLPKIIMPIQGLTNLTSLGEIVEAGIPNTTWTMSSVMVSAGSAAGGSLTVQDLGNPGVAGGTGGLRAYNLYSDASRSSSIYSNSTTVQQEQIQYPYFIQIATGVEYEVNITNEIELNNPYSLLDVKWSDKILNNISWLRSNGQSNSGTVYVDVYNLILSEYNSAEDEQETIGETIITFRRGQTTGIKITTDKTSFDAILEETGTAWYYVLDTINTAFYLPQTNGFLQFGTGAGKFNEAGLPDHSHTVTVYPQIGSGGWIYGGTGFRFGPSTNTTSLASANNPIYGNSETVQPNAVEGYLYFYVGETVQNANLINAGRILENCATKDYAVDAGFPGNKYVDLSLAGPNITYTAPADGWFAFSKTAGANYQNANMRNMTTEYNVISHGSWTGTTCRLMCAGRKGGEVYLNYDTGGATSYFRFIYAHGEV